MNVYIIYQHWKENRITFKAMCIDFNLCKCKLKEKIINTLRPVAFMSGINGRSRIGCQPKIFSRWCGSPSLRQPSAAENYQLSVE